MGAKGLGFRVRGLGLRIKGLELRKWGLGVGGGGFRKYDRTAHFVAVTCEGSAHVCRMHSLKADNLNPQPIKL